MENILLWASMIVLALVAFLGGIKAALEVFKDKTETKIDDKAHSVVSIILEWLNKVVPFLKK